MADLDGGRANQRRRTRKDLLQAASALMRQGRTPSLEEVAEAALVSRATAYRYFPSIEALLLEASLDVAFPPAETVLAGAPAGDPAARLLAVDAAVAAMIRDNEPALRLMLASSLQKAAAGGTATDDGGTPLRQDRRSPLIRAALAGTGIAPEAAGMLARALALVIGTEAMVVCKDVLQLDEEAAAEVRRWAIGALVAAARAP